MQKTGTQQHTGRNAGKGAAMPPPGEQQGTSDTQSEFSVNEARQAAAQEENAQRQQNADSGKQQAQQSQKQQKSEVSAQAQDPQSEFSVEQRLREDKA